MKKKLAVIGYGGMGAGYHCRRALAGDAVELKGIFDIDPAKRALAEKNGIHAYPSREALLSDPEVEIVTVATPNDSHEEIVIAALNAGKNVICEKPVALSLASLERMISAAKKNGKVFSVHQNRRFDIDVLAIKKIIESGEIGNPINLESRIHGSRGIPSDWRGRKSHGGGMLYDWGIHIIDQACMVLGYDVKAVTCNFDHITNSEVDDGFQLRLEFADGRWAYLEVGTYNFISMPRFYLRCDGGTALINHWDEPAHIVRRKYWNESDVDPVKYASGLTKTMAPRDSVTVDEYDLEKQTSDPYDYYRNFVKACDGIEPQLVTHAEMRRVLRIIMCAFRSAAKDGEKIYI